MNHHEYQQDDVVTDVPPRACRRWWIALVIAAFLAGYPLSIGPIMFLDGKYPEIIDPIEPALDVAYAPIEYLYENSELVRKFYNWYLPWWGFVV
jgi:hypothetical protein